MTTKSNDRITMTTPKFDDQVLKQRQAARHNQYHLTSESFEVARGEIAFEFLTKVIELSAQGYELSDKYPIISAPMSYSSYMRKPDAIIATDLQVLDAQVKQDYIAWLESERDSYKQQLTAQLIQTAQEKERKREEDKKAKLLADIQKEVDATFGKLVIPV